MAGLPDLKAIYSAAVELPPELRAEYLDQVTAGDAALRRRVDDLLQVHDNPDSFLSQPAFEVTATLEVPTSEPLAEGAGTVIGSYKLLQQIGEGGMGAVFMAEQSRPVQRMVALKIIKPGMDSRQVIARLEAERQALALMDHPNIAKMLDAGTTETGRPYFVMELVKGIPITRYCDDNHLSPRQRLELFIPVCQAVQHAHQKGIIHRDLKPSNVLVALYDGRPIPKVIDFGVAKATGQKLTERTMFTQFGQIVGTLEYMSPEQAELNQVDIDTRSDIYSLGVLLYELLTGTTPFESKRLREAAFDEILRIIREDDPPKPSTRLSTTDQLSAIAANRGLESKKLRGTVRGDLDWIVMKSLEKDRARRYDTASSLAADVACYLGDQPILAARPSAVYRVRKFVRRHCLQVAAALVILTTLVAGITATMIELIRAANAERIVLEEKNAVTAERDRANSALGLLASEQQNVRNALAEKSVALEHATSTLRLFTAEQAKVRDAVSARSAAIEREKFGAYGHSINLAYRDWLEGDRDQAENRLNAIGSDFRHWEWYYLKHLWNSMSLANAPSAVGFVGARLPVTADGKQILDLIPAPASEPKIQVVDTLTGAIERTLTKVPVTPRMLAVADEGRVIAAAWQATEEGRSQLSLLSGETGESLSSIDLPYFLAENLAVCDNGRLIAASGSTPGVPTDSKWEIRVWKDGLSGEGRPLRKRTGPCSLVFSPDGAHLLTSGKSGFTLWETERWTEVSTDGQSPPDETSVSIVPCFSRDGRWFAHASKHGVVVLRDAGTGEMRRSYALRQQGVSALAFGNRDGTLAYGTIHGNVALLDLHTGKETIRLRLPYAVNALELSADGSSLITMRVGPGGNHRGQLEIWDANASPEFDAIPGSSTGLHTAAISGDGHLVASVSERNSVSIWETASHEFKRDFKDDSNAVFDIAFSPDGTQVAAAGNKGVSVWSMEQGNQLHSFPCSAHRVSFANDGKWLVGVTLNNAIVWDLDCGTQVQKYDINDRKGVTHSAVLSLDATRLVSCGQSGLLHLWETAGGSEVFSVGQKPSAYTATFSPDEMQIAICSGDAKISIYSAETGAEIMALSGHTGGANTVTYSRDGKRIVSAGCRDRTVKIWDAGSGMELLSLTHPCRTVYSAAISADSRRIVTSGSDGIVRIWDAGVNPTTAHAQSDEP